MNKTPPAPLSCQKHLFSLDTDTHYLNGAYMSPMLKSVEAAGGRGMQRKRDPSRIKSIDFFSESDMARARFARLINAPHPERIAIIPSASYAIANVANNIKILPGQNIVLLDEQFPSNVYAWRAVAPGAGVIRVVPAPNRRERRAQVWNERILDCIDRESAVVSLAPVHWADGTRFDLEAIGQRAREVGAAFVIDGTQAVGALPFDVQALQPDALICAAYKWLLGPYSIGVAYFGPRFDGGSPIENSWMLRQGSEDFSKLVDYQDAYQPGAIRYDVGERSNFILVPMLIAAIDQLLDWGVDRIQGYCRPLVEPFLEEVRSLGFWVEDAAWRGAHLFGLRAPDGIDTDALVDALARRNVSVSVRGDSVRVSVHLYNDAHDLEVLLSVLRQAVYPATPRR